MAEGIFIKFRKLEEISARGKSDHINHEKDKQISKDLFVITNDCMRDHRSNHGGH